MASQDEVGPPKAVLKRINTPLGATIGYVQNSYIHPLTSSIHPLLTTLEANQVSVLAKYQLIAEILDD